MLTLLITLITSLTHGPIAAVGVFLLSLVLEIVVFIVFANSKYGKDAISAVRAAFTTNERIEDNPAVLAEKRATYDKWVSVYTKLANELSRSPTLPELANELSWTEEKTKRYSDNARKERFRVVTGNTNYNTLILSLEVIRGLASKKAFWEIDDTRGAAQFQPDDMESIYDLIHNRSPLLMPYLDLSDKIGAFSKTIFHASLSVSLMDQLISRCLLKDMPTDKYRAAIKKVVVIYRNSGKTEVA